MNEKWNQCPGVGEWKDLELSSYRRALALGSSSCQAITCGAYGISDWPLIPVASDSTHPSLPGTLGARTKLTLGYMYYQALMIPPRPSHDNWVFGRV